MGESILIIACGNSLRCDDGAGLVLAEKLALALERDGHEVRLMCVHQLAPELAFDMAKEDVATVLFVDTAIAALEGEPRLRLQPLPTTSAQLASTQSALAHHLTPQALLLYAGALYGRVPPALLVTIPGRNFEHGTAFSPTVQVALQQTESMVRQLVPHLPCRST